MQQQSATEPRNGYPAVQLKSVSYRFSDFVAIDDVTLDVWPGEFVTLLGPSGSGKSTLLRIISGLAQPYAGKVFMAGENVTSKPPQHRDVGFVFQNYALFPHLSVFENVAYSLRVRKLPKAEIHKRVERVLYLVNLAQLGTRYPNQLSGGQQQRVAVARALVYEPAVLLMDEPLGALDRQLRKHMQIELRQLQQDLGVTCIYVTHDQEEALTMSDRIVIMRDGRVHQQGCPVEIYRKPNSSFVADFIGMTNLVRCVFSGEGPSGGTLATDAGTTIPAPSQLSFHSGAAYYLAIRPEFVRIGTDLRTEVQFDALVRKVIFVGNVFHVTCGLPNGELITAELPGSLKVTVQENERTRVGWDQSDINVFAINS